MVEAVHEPVTKVPDGSLVETRTDAMACLLYMYVTRSSRGCDQTDGCFVEKGG
jgi:hypothetical protein